MSEFGFIRGFAVTLTFAGVAAAADLPSHFEVTPELGVSLFAREPEVVDPVALCFDAAGRMYVVEMRDYPYGLPPGNQPGGTVRLLEDTDRDGRADRSELFADTLSYPTSIAPYRDGVIVTAPPEVVFLKDTNGDGKADVREVLFRGFRRGVTDGNMSGLRWGLDNWLHGVNGGPGGDVVSTRKRGDSLRLGDLDFRLRPDTGEIETTYSTGGGFGLVFDEWGRSFTPHNVNHIQMRIMPARLLSRSPGLPPVEGTHSISDHGEMARIFAISEAQTRPNHPEQGGHFSAAGAVGFIGHQGYPPDLAGSVTVADVVGNLIHRDVLTADGPILKAGRAPAEQNREFLASTDLTFRPTALELGPDGALYVADMQRDVIEHPDYIPAKMRAQLDIRAGADRGRIYRLMPRRGVTQNQKAMAALTPAELVEELASPNQWRRLTAQRLIVENNHLVTTAPLEDLVKVGTNSVARLHALWTLHGLGELGDSVLAHALKDSAPGVVENAIQIAATLTDAPELRTQVQSLAVAHPDPRVRFMAAAHSELSTDAVVQLLLQDGAHRWSRLAALGALRGGESMVLIELLNRWPVTSADATARGEIARDLGALLGARAPVEELQRAVLALASRPPPLVQAALHGLREGLARRPSPVTTPELLTVALEACILNAPIELQKTAWLIEKQLGLPAPASQARAVTTALRLAADADKPVAVREAAIQLLTLSTPGEFVPVLLPLFSGATPVDLQRAALEVLRGPTEVAIARGLLERWREIHPSLKRGVTTLLLSRRDYHEPLLDAVESGRVTLGELNLDLEDRRRLISWSSAGIQERARKLIGDGEYGNRQGKVEEWLAKLPKTGAAAAAGRGIFEKACASCHVVGTLGHEVGPNLTGQSHRSVEDLVSNILDPNMAINPNYLGISVETKDGELLTGILAAETAEAITLLQAQGIRSTLRRDQLKRQESTGTSLMPEGLEAGLSPQDVRDLVAFLQARH